MTEKKKTSMQGRGGIGDQAPHAEKLTEIKQTLKEDQALGRALRTHQT